jgi:adenosylmethionine-8-amino-7-oxononanoate aminotransferase
MYLRVPEDRIADEHFLGMGRHGPAPSTQESGLMTGTEEQMTTGVTRRKIVEDLGNLDRALLVHPRLPATNLERVVMVEGEGCRVRDSAGRTYLDATGGGLSLSHVGHGRREIADAASRQFQRLEYFTSWSEYSNDRSIELAARLIDLAPETLSRVYFTSGGSEGMEAALKMARYAHASRGRSERTWILSRTNAYHGLGFGSGTATGFDVFHKGFGPLLPHVRHLTVPWPYHRDLFGGKDPTDFLVRELAEVIEELGADNVAAFVGEPIMGVAGVVVPPDDYWPRIHELLREHGIYLILDEVVTGYGRIGAWFGAQHFGIDPDIIVSAKGLTSGYAPLGAVLVSDEIAEAITSGPGFPMGFTNTGHPVSCAVALANLQIIEREDLLGRARATGAYLLTGLRELEDLSVVGEVRGVGMMLAVELVRDPETREPLPIDGTIAATVRREKAVLVRENGNNITLTPPLIMSLDEADEALEAVRSVLERLDPSGSLRPPAPTPHPR